jgi:hypothetical protein
MNTKIIQKCIEELKKETFSKEYVLGMLETFVEMSGSNLATPQYTPNYNPNGTGGGILNPPYVVTNSKADETLAQYISGPVAIMGDGE